MSRSPVPPPDISCGRCRWGAGHTHYLHPQHTQCEVVCPFFPACCFPPRKGAMTSNEVPALQMSETLPRMTNCLQYRQTLFLLGCCLWPPCACLLCCCVWGETRAVHAHHAGAADVTATSDPVPPPPNTSR